MWALKPAGINFLYLEGMKEQFREELPGLGAEVHTEPELAEEGLTEERAELGTLEMELSGVDLEAEAEAIVEETSAVLEEDEPELGEGLGAVDLGELEPVSATGEEAPQPLAPQEEGPQEPGGPLDLADAAGELDLADLSAELEAVAMEEVEAAAALDAAGVGEVSEEEVLETSSEIDLSDLEEELSLEDVLEEVAAAVPEAPEEPVTELGEPTEEDVLEVTLPQDSVGMEEAPRAPAEAPEAREGSATMAEPPSGTAVQEEEIEGEPPVEDEVTGPVSLDLEDLEKELATGEPAVEETSEEPLERPPTVGRGFNVDDDLLKEVEGAKEEAGESMEEGVLAPEEAGSSEEKVEMSERGGGPTIDLSALEDIEVLEVEGVKEEEEPGGGEVIPEVDIDLEALEFTDERTSEGEPPSGGIEAAVGDVEFELEDDWLERKEEDEDEGEEKGPHWY